MFLFISNIKRPQRIVYKYMFMYIYIVKITKVKRKVFPLASQGVGSLFFLMFHVVLGGVQLSTNMSTFSCVSVLPYRIQPTTDDYGSWRNGFSPFGVFVPQDPSTPLSHAVWYLSVRWRSRCLPLRCSHRGLFASQITPNLRVGVVLFSRVWIILCVLCLFLDRKYIVRFAPDVTP